jgi:hypothetical protein
MDFKPCSAVLTFPPQHFATQETTAIFTCVVCMFNLRTCVFVCLFVSLFASMNIYFFIHFYVFAYIFIHLFEHSHSFTHNGTTTPWSVAANTERVGAAVTL